jgi:hypothetical protein
MAFTSLTLYANEADTVGVKVADLGPAGVETGLNDKDDTVFVKLPIRGLKAGKYTFARAGVAHVRFKIRATMHDLGAFVAGEFDNVQALSDGAVLDGQVRKKGWYRYTFSAPGVGPVTQEGPTAPLPQSSGRAGIRLEQTPTGMVYAFPIDLTIDPSVTADLQAIWELNTHENFRWTDQRIVNYAAGVFDTTPTVSEPVVSFGANSGRLFFEP